MLGESDLVMLQQGAKQLGIDLSARQLEQFSLFSEALLEWNEKFNLTTKERRALITLRDLASKGLSIVDGKLRALDGKNARPGVEHGL